MPVYNYPLWIAEVEVSDAHSMKRLLTLCPILVLAFSLMAYTSISIGRVQPASKAITYWHLDDCAPPCWAGITLGLTSMDEATDRVTSLFSDFKLLQRPVDFLNRIHTWIKNDNLAGGRGFIDIQSHEGVVHILTMRGDYPDGMPTLGEMFRVFGPPTCLRVNNQSGQVNLYYDNSKGQQIFEIGVLQLSIASRVYSICMGCLGNISCQTGRAIAWRGFRSIELYLADMATLK